MQKTHEVVFSGDALTQLEELAEAMQVPLDEVASRLVSDEMKRSLLRNRLSAAPVIPFARRRTGPKNFPVTQK